MGWADVKETFKLVLYSAEHCTGLVDQILPLDVTVESASFTTEPVIESVAAPPSLRTTVTHHGFIFSSNQTSEKCNVRNAFQVLMGILQVNNFFPKIFCTKSFVKKLRINVHSDTKGI